MSDTEIFEENEIPVENEVVQDISKTEEEVNEVQLEIKKEPKKKTKPKKKRKELSEERKAQLREQLRKGREKSLQKRRALKEAGVKREYNTPKKKQKEEENKKQNIVNNYYSNESKGLDYKTFSTFMDQYQSTNKKNLAEIKKTEKPEPVVEKNIDVPIMKKVKYCGINF